VTVPAGATGSTFHVAEVSDTPVAVAVAFADSVIVDVLVLIAETVVPAGMPAPVMVEPTATPVKLETDASVGDPLVVFAVKPRAESR
jgi:hypothetical protein